MQIVLKIIFLYGKINYITFKRNTPTFRHKMIVVSFYVSVLKEMDNSHQEVTGME